MVIEQMFNAKSSINGETDKIISVKEADFNG